MRKQGNILQLDNNISDEQTIAEKFFKLNKTECDKQSVMNKLIKKVGNKEQKRLNKLSDEYLNEVYYNTYIISVPLKLGRVKY